MKQASINNHTYTFVSDFKNDTKLRHSYNDLAKATFNFDFEGYYQSGYWNDRYTPYALLDDEKIVANIAINMLDFFVCGEMKRYIQIGTVMTDKSYRGKGLSRFLLENILATWEDKTDMIYLCANDSVIEFYPKFGFIKKLNINTLKT